MKLSWTELALFYLIKAEILAGQLIQMNELGKDKSKPQHNPNKSLGVHNATTNRPITLTSSFGRDRSNNMGDIGKEGLLSFMPTKSDGIYKKRTSNIIVGGKLLSFLDNSVTSNDMYSTAPKTISVFTEINTNQTTLPSKRLPNYTGGKTAFTKTLSPKRTKDRKHSKDAQNHTLSTKSVNNHVSSYQVTKNPIIDDIKDKWVTKNNIQTNLRHKHSFKSTSSVHGLRNIEDPVRYRTRGIQVHSSPFSTISAHKYNKYRRRHRHRFYLADLAARFAKIQHYHSVIPTTLNNFKTTHTFMKVYSLKTTTTTSAEFISTTLSNIEHGIPTTLNSFKTAHTFMKVYHNPKAITTKSAEFIVTEKSNESPPQRLTTSGRVQL